VVYGAPGLTTAEIVEIQDALGFSLPEDFVYLFQNLQDPGGVLFPWKNFDKKSYDNIIGWVFRGIEFDIERNKLWLDRWGQRQTILSQALEIARRDFTTWPKLLPVCSHRFLVAQPCCPGNPAYSIVQTHIICYGVDLAHYLMHEFVDNGYVLHAFGQRIREIPVWSELVR
jgi:hypothetical protein